MTWQTPLIMCDMPLALSSAYRIILRMANSEDIPKILDYFNENRIYLTPYYPSWQVNFFTEAYWQSQVEANYQDFHHDNSLRLFIFSNDNPSTIIGCLNFNNFVRGIAQYCNVGYSLAEGEQGKGYMTAAMQGGIQYMFQELKMHRISANYMPHNQRSGNLLKRLGFIVEGYARDYLMINGKWEDHILTSLINQEW